MWPSRSVPKTTGTPSATRELHRLDAARAARRPACPASRRPAQPLRPRRPARRRSTASAPGTRRVGFITRAVASSIRLPCSIERTPACTARVTRAANRRAPSRTGWRPRLPRTAARSSSIENCVPSSGSVGLAMPPPAMILIWLAPLRTCSRTARRTSPTPSAMAPIRPSPAQVQNISRGARPWAACRRGRRSARPGSRR